MAEAIRFQIVPFRHEDLRCVETSDGGCYLMTLPICQRLGMDGAAEWRRLSDPLSCPWAVGHTLDRVRLPYGSTAPREVQAIRRTQVPMWLTSIPPSAVAMRFRRDLADLQCEAAAALDAYFNRGVAVNPRFNREEIEVELRRLWVRELEIGREVLSAGGLSAKDEVILKDAVRNRLTGGGDSSTVSVSLRCRELGYTPPEGTDQYISLGQRIAAHYRRRHGKPPPKHVQQINNRATEVCTYTRDDCADVLDPAIREWHRERGIDSRR